jgi:hypothetical protein
MHLGIAFIRLVFGGRWRIDRIDNGGINDGALPQHHSPTGQMLIDGIQNQAAKSVFFKKMAESSGNGSDKLSPAKRRRVPATLTRSHKAHLPWPDH